MCIILLTNLGMYLTAGATLSCWIQDAAHYSLDDAGILAERFADAVILIDE